jgi:hypothetical protein
MPKQSRRKATAGSFKPGDPRAGRPPGRANRATREIRELAQRLLTDQAYQQSLKERLIAGTAGKIEELLYFYAWGKPPERSVTVEDDGDDAAQTPAEVIVIKSRTAGNGTHA